MNFTPKNEQEIREEKESNLLPIGLYDYEVTDAWDQTSAAGNEMIKLQIAVFSGESERKVTDYLMEKMIEKLYHFCSTNGLEKQFDAGKVEAAHCIGLSGRAKVGIEKDKKGKYAPKNSIVDYVFADSTLGPVVKAAKAEPAKKALVADLEDVPF